MVVTTLHDIRLDSIMLQNLPIMLFGISLVFCLLCFLGMHCADNLYIQLHIYFAKKIELQEKLQYKSFIVMFFKMSKLMSVHKFVNFNSYLMVMSSVYIPQIHKIIYKSYANHKLNHLHRFVACWTMTMDLNHFCGIVFQHLELVLYRLDSLSKQLNCLNQFFVTRHNNSLIAVTAK